MSDDVSGAVEAQAIHRGGPLDGTIRSVKTDAFGFLPAYPVPLGDPAAGGIYWPTFERDDDRLIYQWREGPEPETPPWIKEAMPVYPRIARHPGGGVFWFVGTPPDPAITFQPDGPANLSRAATPEEAHAYNESLATFHEFHRDAFDLLHRVAERSSTAPSPHGPIPFSQERIAAAWTAEGSTPENAASRVRITCPCGWAGSPVAYLTVHVPPGA